MSSTPFASLPPGGGTGTPSGPALASYGPLTEATAQEIRAIHAREAVALNRLARGSEALALRQRGAEVTRLRLSVAARAVMDAVSREPERAKAARRRAFALSSTPVYELLGWRSLRDVAQQLGWTRWRLTRHLTGQTDMKTRDVFALAAVLGTQPGKVLDHLRLVQAAPLKLRPHRT